MGDLRTFAAGFRKVFEPALTEYLDAKVADLGTLDATGQCITSVLREFVLGGGKRIRPTLVALGHEAAGGRGPILKPAIAAELFHAFFLVHDDIIDRSPLRHNRPTVHRVFEESRDLFGVRVPPELSEEFARSLAILAGDLCCAFAYDALTQSGFPPEHIIRATRRMHAMAEATLVGQVLDVLLPLGEDVGHAEIERIHVLKTAHYSFESPLHLGMILAGADDDLLARVSKYALPIGIAFQIRDDILGMFGTEAEVGKPVTSDLAEGKQTLLTVFARARARPEAWVRLDQLIGKRDASAGEMEEVRSIIRESGALAASEDHARALAERAVRALETLPVPESSKQLLAELAGYAIGRKE
jgi:geranylgeranyl diphosphate synthase type I